MGRRRGSQVLIMDSCSQELDSRRERVFKMGWQKFLMKRGLGSPGYIAKRMARTYRIGKENYPSMDERTVIRRLFVQRVGAQSVLGGPVQYQFLKQNPDAIEELVDHNPDLFSIITLAIFIEHPELLGPGAPADAFKVLTETVQEVLDSEAPRWRTDGVWRNRAIVCSLCRAKIDDPNPAFMTAAINENGEADFLCARCAPPLQVRAMSALGFFMGR